jgi:hypothetical protein
VSVVDEGGVRFKIPFPDSVGPAQDPSAAAGYADLAATDNGHYLVYRFWGGDVTVCSTTDGSIRGSAPVGLHDEIWAVSSDARFVFLVDRGKQPGISGPEFNAGQRVAVVDTTTGESLKTEAVQALVTGSDRRLGLVQWSSHDHAFLLQIVADPCAVYSYDPARDSLAQVTGIDAFRGVSDTGVIIGATGSSRLQGGGIDFGRPVMLDRGRLVPVDGSGSWDYGVAISPDGSILVFDVVNATDAELLGWQTFSRTGNECGPDSPVYKHPVNYAKLNGISEDNRTAWGVTLVGSSRYDYQLVSLDTETGRWDEWFGRKDLEVAPEDFYLEIPIFR